MAPDDNRAAAVTSSAHPIAASVKSIRCGRRPSSTRRTGSTVANHHSETPIAASVARCTLPGLAKNVSQMSTAEAVIPKTSDLATQTSFMASTIWVRPLRASSNNISVLSR